MKSTPAAMLAKARRSLDVARTLQTLGHHDFAASRAYYAMFYAAEALLWTRGLSYSSHGNTIGAYGKQYSKTGLLDPKFHRWLRDAEDLRLAGDYETESEISSERADQTCERAQEFVDAVEGYLRRDAAKGEAQSDEPK